MECDGCKQVFICDDIEEVTYERILRSTSVPKDYDRWEYVYSYNFVKLCYPCKRHFYRCLWCGILYCKFEKHLYVYSELCICCCNENKF